MLFELPFFFGGGGSFGSAVGRGAVLCNARRRRRICTGSNPTSVMKKRMDYISSTVVKTRVASITEGKHIIHGTVN